MGMSIRARKHVGVIGLGIIGQRVTNNLREHGFHVFVWNRTPRPVPNFVGSPSEVAELCNFIQIFVSDDEALLEMVQRISRDLGSNHIVMAHCTVSPDTMRAAAEIVGRRGAQLLDAPFTGSKGAAEKGQLVYYVGGDADALQQARPILQASSKEIIEIGAVGDATTVKVATNMVTASTVQGAAEALALIAKAGLPAEKFVEAMRNNGTNSATLDMKLPMMIEGTFEPHFSVKHMLKDVGIATRLARLLGLQVGATEAARQALLEEMRHDRGNDDYSSLFRQYFPAGVPHPKDPASNGEEEQPNLSGLEEKKAVEPISVTEDESTPIMEVAPRGITPLSAHITDTERMPFDSPSIEPNRDESLSMETSPTEEPEAKTPPVDSSPAVIPETESAPLSGSEAESKSSEMVPISTPSENQAGGMWGGFWRRQNND
jgi:3-hydroxyisobutyrate dehydrogenase-like beta-hydroxyacid dehydrogenase